MDRIAIIRAEAQRFADVLSKTAPDARCPTCPDWSASDLLWHLTEVHFFWAGVLEQNARTESDLAAVEQTKPDRPSGTADLLALREQATSALLDQLGRIDDAELIAGLPVGPIAPEVAAGAVDHAIVMWGWQPEGFATAGRIVSGSV